VINAPIKTLDVPVNIPADYKSLQNWHDDDFINTWNYNGYYDSTSTNGLPVITGGIDSVKIISADHYKLTLIPKFKFTDAICCFPFTVVNALLVQRGLLFEKCAVANEV
jgi:hypothetical protein